MPALGSDRDRADPLAGLSVERPRLMLTPARVAELRLMIANDRFAARLADDVRAQADALRAKPPPPYPTPPANPLVVARDYLDRVLTCGLTWAVSGRAEYAQAVRAAALAVCAFADWSANALTIGETAQAVALAYDWIHGELSEDERATIRRALVRCALEPGLKAYAALEWWVDTYVNWAPVAHGGLVAAALAIADEEPAWARAVLPRVRAWLPAALASFDPDGAWCEGPAYWSYAVDYAAMLLSSLDSALGTDFGLGDRSGLRDTGLYPIHAVGPSGRWASYGDVCGNRTPTAISPRGRRATVPALLWLARRYDRPAYAHEELRLLRDEPAQALDLLWYDPVPRIAPHVPWLPQPLAKRFGGPVELACLRSQWHDRRALFAYLKAGTNGISHGHLDLGAFELDALGQRWASDLGYEQYHLPQYFDFSPASKRWTYLRTSSAGHNVPLLDGANQVVGAHAQLVGFSDDAFHPHAIVEFAAAYAPTARRARRGLTLFDGRAALVQDEFTLTRPCRYEFGLMTDATVALDGRRAELTQDGEALVATILEPPGARFAVASADRPAPESPNPGVSRLSVAIDAGVGDLRVAILLAPRWPDGACPPPPVRSLAAWGRA